MKNEMIVYENKTLYEILYGKPDSLEGCYGNPLNVFLDIKNHPLWQLIEEVCTDVSLRLEKDNG